MGFFSNLGNSLSSGGAGIVSGLANGIMGLFGQRRQQKWQEEMMQKQMDFQSDEAQKQRDWSSSEAEEARNWNSIVSQLQRAREAGVNPFSLVDSGSYGSAAGATVPSGAHASGSVSIPQPPNASQSNPFSESFNAIAQAVSAMADAERSGVDTKFLKETFQQRIAKLAAETDNQEAVAALKKLQENFMRDTYDMSKSEIEKKLKQQDLVIQKLQFEQDMDYPEFKKVLQEAQLAFSRSHESGANAEFIRSVLTNYYDAVTRREEAMTEGQRMSNEVRASALSEEKKLQLKNIEEELKRADTITASMSEALEYARKNNDWYTYGQILKGIESAVGVLGGASKIGALIQTGKALLESSGTSESTTTSYDSQGRVKGFTTTTSSNSRHRGR